MEKILIIAEKPSLAKTIAGALKAYTRQDGYFENDKYIVSFAFGHLFELYDVEKYLDVEKLAWKDTKLPFIPKEFKFNLKNDDGVKKQFGILKNLVKKEEIKEIINCGDSDREGQLIIDLIIANIGTNKPVKRLWLPEQTEETIRKQMNNLDDNSKYKNLYDEGIARTYLDWLLGINITRYITVKSGTLLRAGRVLIPVVKFIYDRDMAIRNFKVENYYQVESPLKIEDIALLLSIKDKKFNENEEEAAKKFAADLNKNKAIVTSVENKEVKKYPGKLFSLSKLQSFLSKNNKISFSTSEKIIQELYQKGYITYPRTNTEYLAENEKDKVKEIIGKLPEKLDLDFKDTKKIFDSSKIESHSAITITTKIPKEEDITDEKEKIVYKAVFNRFVSNFLKEETLINQVIATIKVGEETFEFKGETVKQEGFLKYEPQKIENNLPKFNEGDSYKVDFKPVKKKTSPPKAATEEELANYLKNPFRTEKTTEDEEYKAIFEGVEIGTEATRTGIIENAKHNNYISQKGSNFSLEPLGEKLIEILDKLNINLYKDKTVEFSKILKKVYRGETKIDNLIEMTKKELEEIIKTDAEIEKINKEDLKEDLGECPLCKVGKIREMKTKEGNKIFYNCSNKECKFFMWEDTKYYQSPIKVTKAKLKSLLAGKKVAFKLISKAGKEYEMYLKLQVDGKFVNFKDDGFVNKKKK
ncbi:DNA topoisomerase [Fusobacterium ulcerans]|uniref:DNA topoisomerase n=1 Tax=Fusobacterium ulcerans TaxID=861 RepID=UPI002E76F64D|nr:DNA topoisomerase [Fusobacterium ulcerans]MEE0137704.1 DNA topoisomerase [Fusobacterium ulcerans]